MAEPPTVAEVADRYVDQLAALDPLAATYLGVAGHEHELPDLSPAGVAAGEALVRRTLADLAAAPVHGERDRVAKAVMQERLQLQAEQHAAGLPFEDCNVIACPVQDLRGAFDLMQTDGPDGWEAVRSRLEGLPATVAGLVETYREGVRRGLVPARRQVLEVAQQCRAWAGLAEDPGFFTSFVAPAGDDALTKAAAGAEGAFARLAAYLADELAPAAREGDPVGRERYAFGARSFTGADLDLEATYAWGWEELGRIVDERRRVAAEVVPGGDVRAAVAALDDDPARVLHGTDALQAWMQDLSDGAVEALQGTHFEIPEPIRRLRCAISPPGGTSGAYYTGPSEDLSRPGTMWWSPAPDQTTFTTWREVTTVYHEGVPGHHLQVAQVAINAANLTRYQRVALFVSGHGEGWALYAERLMDELGYLDDPGDRLGLLDSQAFRAARVVLDIGAHLQLPIPPNPLGWHVGEAWTPELMRQLLRDVTLNPEGYVVDEVNRYLGWPGQAISYKVGEKVWLEAREDARRRLGAAFDLKRFHAAALDLGPMGLDPLREELARVA